MTDDLGRASYRLEADYSKLEADLNRAEAEIRQTGAAAEKAFDGRASAGAKTLGRDLDDVRTRARNLGGEFKTGLIQGAGIGAFLGVTNAVELAIRAIGGAVNASSDLREAGALTSQVFEGSADEIEAWAKTANSSMGASEREAMNLAATFGTALKNVGFSLDETGDKSIALAELAGDLGSAFNASSQEAGVALRSGLLGESEPLRRFGVFLDEATTKAKAMAMGLGAAGRELTNQEKVTARYALILEQTADSQGMFGRDSGSLADAQKELGAAIENTAADLGTLLVPALLGVVGGVGDAIAVGKELVGTLGDIRDNLNEVSAINLGDEGGITLVSEEDVRLVEDIGRGLDFLATEIPSLTGLTETYAEKQARLAEASREAGRGLVLSAQAARDSVDDTDAAASANSQLAEAFGPIREEAGLTAVSIANKMAAIRESIETTQAILSGAAQESADAIFDPIIAAQELAVTEIELAEARKLASQKGNTAKEQAEYDLRVTNLEKSLVEQTGLVASYGDEAAQLSYAKAQIATIKSTQEWAKGTPAQKAILRQQVAQLGQQAWLMEREAILGGQGVRDGFGKPIGELPGKVGGKVRETTLKLGGLEIDLSDEGRSTSSSYNRGLNFSAAWEKVRDIAGAVGRWLKLGSPAKEGPFSEAGGPEGWGEAFGAQYLGGLERSLRPLRSILAGTIGDASGLGLSPALAFGASSLALGPAPAAQPPGGGSARLEIVLSDTSGQPVAAEVRLTDASGLFRNLQAVAATRR